MKRLILALVFVVSPFLYTACEKKIEETALENVVWVSYYDLEDVEYEHTLVFYSFGVGHETIIGFYPGGYFWDTYTFEWYWGKKANTVVMEYENIDLEFEIQLLKKDTLYGKFDGEYIGFVPYPR